MPRPEKTQAVAEITERFQEASGALLTEYRGLHVGEIAEVRGALRDAQADYKVLKNTLARIAVREAGLEELVEMLQGPTAIAFVRGDAVEAAKALDDAAKKYPVLVIKGGVIEGKIIDGDQARALAKLEPRETQLAKIVMMVNTPLQQTANVLSALLRDFGSMLAQVVEQKQSEAPADSGEEASGAEGGLATEADAEGAERSGDDAGPDAPAAEADGAEAAPAETPPATEETLENPDVGPAPETDEATETPDESSGSEEEGKE